MKVRLIAIALCFLLVASLTLALEGPRRQIILRDSGGDDDNVVQTCRTVYKSVCSSMNHFCVMSQAQDACCGDCKKPDGTHDSCNACSVN